MTKVKHHITCSEEPTYVSQFNYLRKQPNRGRMYFGSQFEVHDQLALLLLGHS
jgi:hypothetical protein